MGTSISIDKSNTPLNDLLTTHPTVFSSAQELFSAPQYAHHLKIWRFSEDSANPDLIKYSPIGLAEPQDFHSQECYLVLLIYCHEPPSAAQNFPNSLWGTVESLSNLTPRGLENVFSTDDAASLDSFLLSKRPREGAKLHYMLFIWNGKRAGPLVKAIALTRGFELDAQLVKGELGMLHVLFSGGLLNKGKVQQGQLITLESAFSSAEKPERPVYLLKWLWPEHPAPSPAPQPLFPRFREYFLSGVEALCEEEPPAPQLQIVLKPKLSKLNMAGLQTREEQRAGLEGLDKEGIEALDHADIRDTVRKELKNSFYNGICSKVDQGLYVGSDTVARDRDKLREHRITHVVNCAANVCKNYFPDSFTYIHYFLKDSKSESIECVYYEVIEFIEDAINKGGSVFVHCMQGVSRSVTLCLAYMIYKHKYNFETVFKLVKEIRGVASPNFGFQVQLIWWHKRLYEDYETLPVVPRVFSVGSYQIENPSKIVCRLLMENPFQNKFVPPLDSRGIYLLQTSSVLYLWEGRDVGRNRKKYLEVAHRHANNLQTYEKACEVQCVRDGEETEEFWGIFNVSPPEAGSRQNETMDHWYADLDTAVDQEPQCAGEKAPEEQELGKKPTLFVYPEDLGLVVFEDEEMAEEALLVLCTDDKVFVWQGEGFDKGNEEKYISVVCEKFYRDCEVLRVNEFSGRESEEFLNFFYS